MCFDDLKASCSCLVAPSARGRRKPKCSRFSQYFFCLIKLNKSKLVGCLDSVQSKRRQTCPHCSFSKASGFYYPVLANNNDLSR